MLTQKMGKILYVEVSQRTTSTLSRKEIEEMVMKKVINPGGVSMNVNLVSDSKSTELLEHVDNITVTSDDSEEQNPVDVEYKFFVYRLSQEEAATETMQHDYEELSVASHVILPAAEYQGLWESLYYDTDIKGNLLNFVETTMMFSDRKVDHNIISWNKVVLLHGPPGTGKTSLCKAIAQKAAIRLGNRYAYTELVEINSHSLFSKWFSESGKLVMKLFDEVRRLLENPDALVCVLIDEVESLAHARKSCANGTEPSDAIRVVNALLTQLDQIKRYPNVLILTTSNVTEAIDLAFVDRADIKQYIGHPQEKAIYNIYRSCLMELMRTKLVKRQTIPPIETMYTLNESSDALVYLLGLSKMSVGLSGRSLRKIPFLTHAMYVRASECSYNDFIEAMKQTIKKHMSDDFLST